MSGFQSRVFVQYLHLSKQRKTDFDTSSLIANIIFNTWLSGITENDLIAFPNKKIAFVSITL